MQIVVISGLSPTPWRLAAVCPNMRSPDAKPSTLTGCTIPDSAGGC
jgi:hypothetical protein